ncbi:hypothetical protein LLE49_07935 [Alicyclobacillus tolerans]|uniref:hypothetical protein n=1 Tax=Alicyclobacillus tolerans TaxID=90970 RepID=UPI001F367C69|nr:hypothetical protein [Alicyclobacillus tolerans]MCF8564675.1 hypothetical protein [Alicyclobacillus tolerans]
MDDYQAQRAEYYANVYPDLDLFVSSNKLIELIRELQLPDEVADIPTENKPVAVFHDMFTKDIDFNPELDKVVQAVSKQTLGEYVEALKLQKMKENPNLDTSILVTRSYWNQIKHGQNKNPSKIYLLRIAIALRLTIEETEMLFRKAGYSLATDGSKLEAIVAYFISKRIYALGEIDPQLERYDQPVLFSLK